MGQQCKSCPSPTLSTIVHLNAEGVAKMLGELEARVLYAVWTIARPATAREIHAQVMREHRVQLLTVITVLNRLVRKQILRRMKTDKVLHFEAQMSEQEFLAITAQHIAEGIVSWGPYIVTSLVDVLAVRDPVQLVSLARHIEQRLHKDTGRAVPHDISHYPSR